MLLDAHIGALHIVVAILAVFAWLAAWLVAGYRCQLLVMRWWPTLESRLPRDWGPWSGLTLAGVTALLRLAS